MRLCIIVLALAFLASAEAKDPSLSPPPPMAKRATVSVSLIAPTEIPLILGGRIVEPATFLIRKPPKFGRLSELRRTGKNSASVLYTPDPGISERSDSFSFAAQSADSPVSASAIMTLELREEPPDLQFDKELDFGAVFLGESSTQIVSIKNQGGGVMIKELKVEPPWRVRASGAAYIPSGGVCQISLTFDPPEERDYSQRLLIGPDPQNAIQLKGRALAPLSWKKAGIVISPEHRRSGKSSLEIFNRTPQIRTVELHWPDFLSGPAWVEVPAEASTVVPIKIEGGADFAFEGDVSLRSGGFSGAVRLKIFPAPPVLSSAPSGQLLLGERDGGDPLSGRFTVRNSGGTDAALRILVPEGFAIIPDPSACVLPPGKEAGFEITTEKSLATPGIKNQLRLEADGADPLELDILLPSPKKAPRGVPVENFLSVRRDGVASPSPSPGVTSPGPSAVSVADVRLAGPNQIEMEWEISSPEAVGFRLERQRVEIGKSGEPVVSWRPWPEASIRVEGEKAVARLSRLPADSFWTVRILALDAAGQAGPPSPPFRISTPPAPLVTLSPWVWLLLAGLLAAAGGRFVAICRRQRIAQADARLARLQAKS